MLLEFRLETIKKHLKYEKSKKKKKQLNYKL